MFRVLHNFTIIWLLFQTITYCEGTIHSALFPTVSINLTESTFPVTIKVESTSDEIFVKCPSIIYKHSNVEDNFAIGNSIWSTKSKIESEKKIFVWIPLTHNASGHSIVNCGTAYIKSNDTNPTPYNWKMKFNWQSKPKPLVIAKREKISKTLPPSNACDNNATKVIKFTKDKQGKLKRVNIDNGELKEPEELPHANKLYYYFVVPDDNSILEHVPPCAIIRAVNDKPEIKINGQGHPLSPRNNKIYVIKRERMTEVYNIKLHLMSPDAPDFYKGEKILMKEMRYTESSIKDIPNTDEMIMDSFTLHQFKILKFTYNYPTIENDNVVEKMYYFGPMKDDYNFPNQDILYLANETSIQPNCTINGITYGYFDSLTYENKTIKLNDFNNNEKDNFKRSGDYIILKNNKTNMISLMCRYITLTGTVTLTQTFIKGKKVFMGKNEKGEDIYKILSETDGSEYDKKMADKKKEMESMKKSFIDKLIDYIGIGGTYGLIGGICLFIIIIIIIIILLCYFKSIKPRLIRKKIKKTYPNIFELWNDISKQKLEKYSQIGVKRDYVADREQCHDYKKTCEGFEEIFTDTTSLFNNELVKCYKDINGAITAYYIDKISPQKKYIISDGPSNNNINYFWELLYRENVKVIVAFIDIEDDYVNYWPKKASQKYGNINVEFIKNLSANDISHLSIYHFQMTVDVGKPKEITLFHINNWKEHELPKTDLYITKLYDVISSYSGNNITLIHSSKQPDSRSYIYLYFSCVYEVMKEKKNISNPMEIIKDIRENFYGGSISAIEYAFIIKSLISYFMEKNMLLDLINHGLEFNEQYKKYKYKYDSRIIYKNEKVKYFIRFVNMIDRGKLRYLYDKFIITKKIDKKYITKKCSRFYAILQTPNKTKIRHPELPCYDKHSINIGGKECKHIDRFINANEMIYKYGNGKERKIIMCQAPVRATVDDTFDMFYRYRVKVVILLVSKEEIDVLDKCHFKSYPDINKFVQSANYVLINRTTIIDKNSCFFEHDCELQHIATKKTLLLKLIQYMDWPNKNIPVDRKTLYGLYKRTVEICKNDYLVIQCSSGVGRSGTLAMIIHMIDTIDKENPFDPFKSLDFIRQHRYKGVQTISQFFLALCILYQHFEDDIKFVDKKLYDQFMELAQIVFDGEKLSYC